jgi:hypothetical protein
MATCSGRMWPQSVTLRTDCGRVNPGNASSISPDATGPEAAGSDRPVQAGSLRTRTRLDPVREQGFWQAECTPRTLRRSPGYLPRNSRGGHFR